MVAKTIGLIVCLVLSLVGAWIFGVLTELMDVVDTLEGKEYGKQAMKDFGFLEFGSSRYIIAVFSTIVLILTIALLCLVFGILFIF